MIRPTRRGPFPPNDAEADVTPPRAGTAAIALLALGAALAAGWPLAGLAADYPVSPQQRNEAQQVATNGVALAELAPDAPDSYTVKPRDTLWDISRMFLRSPWRWPELWGMNLAQIRNPHLIYPGQLLVLDKSNGRARLRFGQVLDGGGGTVRLEPRIRASDPGAGAITSIAFNLIEPFLNEAVIFQSNELEAAPRIVATQEGRVLLGRGDTAYVRGNLGEDRDYRIFRRPKELRDPGTKELLGYEATYVGAAQYTRQGETHVDDAGKTDIVPATFVITSIKQEAGVGDRLAVVPPREFANYSPHAPSAPISGRIVSVYGDALYAGSNQIVSINKGAADGIERGHVLALLRNGARTLDTTDGKRTDIKLPDERQGVLFVFRVFDRMSYALILSVSDPITAGDRFSEP